MAVDGEARRRIPWLLLVLAVLIVAVVGGVAFLVLRKDPLDRPARPLTDQQSETQVVDAATEVVTVGRLRTVAAGYLLMSCRNETDPPYQGAIRLTFELPESSEYLDQVAASLVSHGWHQTAHEFKHNAGVTVFRDGVTAVLSRDPDRRGSGLMKLYGECRNTIDHRNDLTGWVDITDEFR